MNFQDVVDLSIEQEEILKGVKGIILDLIDARSIHDSWVKYSFSTLYSGNIINNGQSSASRDYVVSEFNRFREKLISIDAYDLAVILSKLSNCFSNSEIDKYIKEIEINYKNVVSFRKIIKSELRISEMDNCVKSIDNIINAYRSIQNVINYIKVIDEELSQGMKEPALLIRSNVHEITEESIKYIMQPITIIYNKLCELGNINILEEPLRIVRLESGTLNFKFDGNNSICKVIAKILEDCHNLFIKNFTKSGKKENIAESLELVSQQIDIIGSMKSMGIDTTKLEDVARETMGLIIKETNVFLSANPDVKINEKQLNRSEDIKNLLKEPKYLESTTAKIEE